jgi:hypothetical protein
MNAQPRISFTVPHICSDDVHSCHESVRPEGSASGHASTQVEPLDTSSPVSSQRSDAHVHATPCGIQSGVERLIELDSTCPEAVSWAGDAMSQACSRRNAGPVVEAQIVTAVKAKPTWLTTFWNGILKFFCFQLTPVTAQDSTPHMCVISSRELQTRRNQRMRDLCEGTAYEFFVEVCDSATYYIRVYDSTTLVKVTFGVRAATAPRARLVLHLCANAD